MYGSSLEKCKDGPDLTKFWNGRTINKLDMEVCCTLEWLRKTKHRFAEAGLYAYNHNLDTSEEYYKEVISTRGFEDRLQTIEMFVKQMLLFVAVE
jgi:biotin synthase